MEVEHYTIERRPHDVLIVYVHSTDSNGNPLPDAVFTFRPIDPQYEQWWRRYVEQEEQRWQRF
ncbi:MAG: hypothetical protein Q4C70_09345 [Planctomycetia bacterium]|nr:hypothetical protein [Planctomycetia bacterium]